MKNVVICGKVRVESGYISMNSNLQHNCMAHFNKNAIRPLTTWQQIRRYFYGAKWAKSGKHCPRCGNTKLGIMQTMGLRFCPVCHYWFKENKK